MGTKSALETIFTLNYWVRKAWKLLLFLYIISDAQCEPHILSYHYTGMSRSGKLKEFQAMTYIDDQEIMSCKEKMKCQPVASWMKDKEDDSYWKIEHDSFKSWKKAFHENLFLLKHWSNFTNDLLVLQLWYGCEIQNDGDIKVHYWYGFQGRDYALFDTLKLAWDPITNYVLPTDNNRNQSMNVKKSVESHLYECCPDELKKYIGYGRKNLEWKAPPEVNIVPVKITNRMTKLQCLVYGFHPRAVHVKWVRNGVDDVPADEMSPILPHPDGTYQIRVSVEVPTKEGDTYACHVDHSSLREETVILWHPTKNNLKKYVKWIILAIALFLIALGFCILLILQCNKHTKETDQSALSPESTETSEETDQSPESTETSESPDENTSIEWNIRCESKVLHNKEFMR